MPRFAVNIDMLFTELPFLDRFAAAAAWGFREVEILRPFLHDPAAMAQAASDAGVEVILFNTPIPDMPNGDRGGNLEPAGSARFAAEADQVIAMAQALGAGRLHFMAGLGDPDDRATQENLIRNMQAMADRAAPIGLTPLLEPLNTHDFPGYFLNTSGQALDLLDRVGRDNVALQFDFHHLQIMEGDVTRLFRRLLPRIGHIQIANPPDRHEPGVGELDFRHIFDLIDESGYDGPVSLEYRASTTTEESLAWAVDYGIRPSPRKWR